MRQEEEWEQVIQGLQGPGQAQLSMGAGGGLGVREQGSQAGCSPLLFPRELWGGGGWGAQRLALLYSCGARMGGAVDFAPAYKVWQRG